MTYINVEIENSELGFKAILYLDDEKYDELEAREIAERLSSVHTRWWKAREFIHQNLDRYQTIC